MTAVTIKSDISHFLALYNGIVSAMKTILIIEDDEHLLYILSIVLEDLGYAVIKVATEIGVNHIAEKNLHLVVVDLLLSFRLGDELCNEIKGDPRTKHIPVILYSASPFLDLTADKCKADSIIYKPFDMDHFVSEVNRLANP